MKYFASFKYRNMELENESDDIHALKAWVAKLLAEYPSPDKVLIRNETDEEIIYQEPLK